MPSTVDAGTKSSPAAASGDGAESRQETSTSRTESPAASDAKPVRSSPPTSNNDPPDAPGPPAVNGNNAADPEGQNDSEAETVVVERSPEKKRRIKSESNDDRNSDVLHAKTLRSPSSAADGSKKHRGNGVHGPDKSEGKRGHHGDSKRKENGVARPTSPGSTGSVKSLPPEGLRRSTSPSQQKSELAKRRRSSSFVESRKRKERDENTRTIEPPPRRHKIEPSAKETTQTRNLRTQPNSPVSPWAKPHPTTHKRSNSTQSSLPDNADRRNGKNRGGHVSGPPTSERRQWSDDSSESSSSSPRPHSLLHFPPPRAKRNANRSLTSPVRVAPGPKRNTDRFGATQFAKVCEKGKLSDVMDVYRTSPEELDQQDFAGISPLQKASLHGHAAVVRYLIKQGCRTDTESADKDTPLIDAVENGHLEVVQILLHEAKVNPHHQNKKGQRAIDVLDEEEDNAEEIEKELRQAMREHAMDYEDSRNDADLGSAQEIKRDDLLYIEANKDNLKSYAAKGDAVAVNHFLNSNVKPDNASAVVAARGGHEMVLNLLFANADENGRLQKDPDPSKRETPMLAAIGRGHLGVIRLLLEQDNFDPTRRNSEGKTYYEVAEERRGPKWQVERDLLKDRYDGYLSRKQRSPKKMKKMMRKPSPRPSQSSPTTVGPKEKLQRSASSPIRKKHERLDVPKPRRLVSGKEHREGKRRRRVVDDDEDDDSFETASISDAPSSARRLSNGSHSPRASKMAKTRVKSTGSEPQSTKALKPSRPDSASTIARDEEAKLAAAEAAERQADKRQRIETERREMERRREEERLEAARKDAERQEAERREEAVRIEVERKAAEEERLKAERQAAEQRRIEAEREKAERERLARIEEERKEAERVQQLERIEAARKEAERKEEERRMEAERLEAERKAEEARLEAERLAEEQRQREEAERQAAIEKQKRIEALPRALQRAVERGPSRPLHFNNTEKGISVCFLPVHTVKLQEIDPQCDPTRCDELWMMSFQAVGLFGIDPVSEEFESWAKKEVTLAQRHRFLQAYDLSKLADTEPPDLGIGTRSDSPVKDEDGDVSMQCLETRDKLLKESRDKFISMEPLWWVKYADLLSVAAGPAYPHLAGLKIWNRSNCHVDERSRKRVSFADQVMAHGDHVDFVSGSAGVGG